MADETRFEPRLGKIGSDRTRRAKTQLEVLSKYASYGRPRAYGRERLAPGTLLHHARGKGASVAARLATDPGWRRVLTRSQIASAPKAHPRAFGEHLKYLQRDGTDRDGGRAPLFDATSDDVPARSFNDRSRDDSHQFRIIIRPEESGRMEDLNAFTRDLMHQVERDLATPLDWVAAGHFNAAHAHVHIVIRGRNEHEGKLYIDRRYLSYGFHRRSQELVTRELGYFSPEETQKLQHGLARTQGFTTIDLELKRAARGAKIDLSPSIDVLERHGWLEKHLRLLDLRRLGLVRHVHANNWQFAAGWAERLKQLGERSIAIDALARKADLNFDPMSVETPAPGSVGGWITGRLAGLMDHETGTAAPSLLVEGLDGRLWMLPVAEQSLGLLPDKGAVVSVYRPAFGPPRPGIGSEAALPASTPLMIQVNSWLPMEALTERQAFTWLDEINEADIRDLATGFGAEVRAARRARQAFLQAEGLLPLDREDLMDREMRAVAEAETARSGKRFILPAQREVFRGEYTRNLDTAQGRFAVIASEGRFVLAPLTEDMASLRGKTIAVERAPMSRELTLARGRTLGR